MSATDYLILPPSAEAPTVRAALLAQGLHLVNTILGDAQRLSSEEVWASQDQLLAVNIVDDPLVDCQYLALRGDKRQALGHKLTSALGLITPQQGLAHAASATTGQAQIKAVYHLVVLFPEFDPEVMALLSSIATNHADDQVREATVDAMAYRAWPQCAPALGHIAESDHAIGVRQRAKQVLAFVTARAGQR